MKICKRRRVDKGVFCGTHCATTRFFSFALLGALQEWRVGMRRRETIGVEFTKIHQKKKKRKKQTHTTEDISECSAPAVLPRLSFPLCGDF